MSDRNRMLAVLALVGATSGAALADFGDVYIRDLRVGTQEVFYMPTDASVQNHIGFAFDWKSFAMDFNVDATELWALNQDPATNFGTDFGIVNLNDGTFTSMVPLTGDAVGLVPTGLTFDPNGSVYMSTGDTLFSVDLSTGQTTRIGTFGGVGLIIDISIDSTGQMYAHNISDDALYRIDKTTGAATFIGFHGLAANFAQGMDFDWSDDTLYATIYTGGGTGKFVSWDTNTGAITEILDTTPWNYEMEMAVRSPASGGCPADMDGDGDADVNDFFLYLDLFEQGDPRADITGDGTVDVNDFFAYLDLFEQGC